MTRLGRILGRGRRAGEDHDTSPAVDSTAVHPTADSGERAVGLWESGAHREHLDESGADAGTGAPAQHDRTLAEGSGNQTTGLAGEWPSPAADGDDPGRVAQPPDSAVALTGAEPGDAAPVAVGGDQGAEGLVASDDGLARRTDSEVVAETEAPPRGFSVRPRSRMRRRLRYLRRARELQLRDLGGFVYERARTAGGDPARHEQLLQEKIARVRTVDAEIGALAATLGTPPGGLVIREPGVGGTCPTCGELHPSDARFCSNCGTRVDVRGSSGGAQGSVLAAWTNPESQAAPEPLPATPVAWGEASTGGRPTDARAASVPAAGEPAAVVAAPDERGVADAPAAGRAEEPAVVAAPDERGVADAPAAGRADEQGITGWGAAAAPGSETSPSLEPVPHAAPDSGAAEPAVGESQPGPAPDVAGYAQPQTFDEDEDEDADAGSRAARSAPVGSGAAADADADGRKSPPLAEASVPPDDEAPTRVQPAVTNHQEPR